ncbi:hypothetical protein [Priestia endophytica]|uniref:hypothetical protein n=1 Tax=Priestia endophytica TaxID=135735 RepID=UPI000DCA6870|nr:hypothetical protein [Priestia endophytica]RAS85774.1 hypothetical protein A4U60_09120 [Priestia endophytica]
MSEENREKLDTLSTNFLSELLKNPMVSELPDERKGQIKDAVEAFSKKVNELPDERKVKIEAALENFNKLMNAASENQTNRITESPGSLLQILAEEAKKAQEDTNKE